MADDDPMSMPSQEETELNSVSLPARDIFPPPPEVAYMRPKAKAGSSSKTNISTYSKSYKQINSAPGSTEPMNWAGVSAGTSLIAGIVGGAFAGNYIDTHWIHSNVPWATLILIILATVVGLLNMQRLLTRNNRK